MSRLPSGMLTHSVGVALATGSGPRGATFADPVTRPAHVEEKASLQLDERTTSDTAGQLITMTVFVVVQLDRTIVPGSRIDWLGRTLTVGRAAHLEHRAAPSHSELWCVG